MNIKKDLFLIFASIIIISLSISPNIISLVNIANAQSSSSCYNGVVMPRFQSNSLPVILIHGFYEDSSVWHNWESRLYDDGIPYCTVTFQSNDRCGYATNHANELSQIVQRVKMQTQQNQVNIVGHSKGGLDARVYLSENQGPDVANLIMIGTPNGGDSLADLVVQSNINNPWFYYLTSYFCTPALYDLETSAKDTQVAENTNTNYYIIYGDWNTNLPCSYDWLDYMSYYYLANRGELPNDGVVSANSVTSLPYYINLGSTPHCHQDLLQDYEYDRAQNVLNGQ
jgi:pimeloyl-ACP methyl ester carboxylesterase